MGGNGQKWWGLGENGRYIWGITGNCGEWGDWLRMVGNGLECLGMLGNG